MSAERTTSNMTSNNMRHAHIQASTRRLQVSHRKLAGACQSTTDNNSPPRRQTHLGGGGGGPNPYKPKSLFSPCDRAARRGAKDNNNNPAPANVGTTTAPRLGDAAGSGCFGGEGLRRSCGVPHVGSHLQLHLLAALTRAFAIRLTTVAPVFVSRNAAFPTAIGKTTSNLHKDGLAAMNPGPALVTS